MKISSISGKLLFETPGTDLHNANLAGAYLHNADLSGAYMRNANLARANLSGACLRNADLAGADLAGVNLRNADLSGACLRNADLAGADLAGAYLSGADLSGANLSGAYLPYFQIASGDLTVWKKVQGRIVGLLIPKGAKRTGSLVSRKCRAEYALCLSVEGGKPLSSRGVWYKEGQAVYPDSYDDNPAVECTHGIHFFLTREEAENY